LATIKEHHACTTFKRNRTRIRCPFIENQILAGRVFVDLLLPFAEEEGRDFDHAESTRSISVFCEFGFAISSGPCPDWQAWQM
jgi:hypothetical protein